MNLIDKLTKKSNDNNLINSYCDYIFDDYESMKIKINKLKEILSTLSETRKKNLSQEREELVDDLFRALDYIESGNEDYLYDYHDLKKLLKNNSNMKLKEKTLLNIQKAFQTKNLIKHDFEIIYKNFKNIAKGFEDIPMKRILKGMREAFDFYNVADLNEKKFVQSKHFKYYDSTTMQIRHILY